MSTKLLLGYPWLCFLHKNEINICKNDLLLLVLVGQSIKATKKPEVAPDKEKLVRDLKKTIVRKEKSLLSRCHYLLRKSPCFDILDDLSAQIIDEMREDIRGNFTEDRMMDLH